MDMISAVSLRPIEDRDMEFLQGLFTASWPGLDQIPVSDEQKQQVMQQQFLAQHTHYQSEFPDARFDLILFEGKPAGRIYVDRNEEEIRVLDISLLPEYRNNGIGSRMLNGLMEEAMQARVPIRLWVEAFNPSFRLFERLGFKPIHDPDVDWEQEANRHLEWLPVASGVSRE
jgi:GNAT superfamily N-acetyltransferase